MFSYYYGKLWLFLLLLAYNYNYSFIHAELLFYFKLLSALFFQKHLFILHFILNVHLTKTTSKSIVEHNENNYVSL